MELQSRNHSHHHRDFFKRTHSYRAQTAVLAGRMGEKPSTKLSQSFLAEGFELGRLKTGTPPRLKRDSIDFSRCIVQDGDEIPRPFSFSTSHIDRKQVPCYIDRDE